MALSTKGMSKRYPYLLTTGFSFPSTNILRNVLQEKTGTRIFITTKDRFAGFAAVRYGGNIMPMEGDTDLNSIERINLLANKRSFSTLLRQAGFDAPEFIPYTGGNLPREYPVLVRDTLTASGGRGIHVCVNEEQFTSVFRPGTFWTPFIKMSTEYRIHVGGGEVLKVFEKERVGDEEQYPIRNNDRGYHFSIRNKPRHGESIRQLVNSLSAIPILSTGFFALDVGWCPDEKRLFVIEGNSAPGLNENTAEAYADYILGVNNEVFRARAYTKGVGYTNTPHTRRV